MVYRLLLCGVIIFISGCRNAAQVGGDTGSQSITSPKIEVKVPEPFDRDKFKDDVLSSLDDHIKLETKNTQQQMTGALNVAKAKMADKVTGLETKLEGKFTGIESKINSEVKANFEAKSQIDAKLSLVDDLKIKLQNQIDLNARLQSTIDAQASILSNLQFKIGEIQNSTNAQLGWNNTYEQRLEKLNAGRDVNYLPKEAVYIIMGILCVIMAAMAWLGKLTRQHEQNRTDVEREERKMTYNLLLEVLTSLLHDGAHTQEIKQKINKITNIMGKKEE